MIKFSPADVTRQSYANSVVVAKLKQRVCVCYEVEQAFTQLLFQCKYVIARAPCTAHARPGCLLVEQAAGHHDLVPHQSHCE